MARSTDAGIKERAQYGGTVTTLLSLASLNAAPRDYKENLGTPLVNNARAVDEDWTLTPPNDDVVANRKKLLEILPDGVDKILFVKRYTLQSTHYYTDFIDGCRNFGGNLCTLSLDDGTVTIRECETCRQWRVKKEECLPQMRERLSC